MKTAMVTGAAGFVGRALVDRLSQSAVLGRALVHRAASSGAFPSGVTTFIGDVRDTELVRRCAEGADVVFHFAARVPKTGSERDEAEVFDVSVNGTRVVLDDALAMRSESFVYLSSLSVYGRLPSSVCDEDAPTAPVSTYGRAKATAERMVVDAGHHSSLRITCLRPVPPQNPVHAD